MEPKLTDMMVLLAVVEAGSFTAAAARLGRTQSAVSQCVSRLEATTQVRLLQRTTRSLTLTEAGQRFHAHCLGIRQLHQAALEDLQALAGAPAGTLTVTAPHAIAGALLVPAVERYLAAYPRMRVELITEDARVDLVARQIDLAIRVGEPSEQAARIVKLGELRDLLCASRSYLQANRDADLADLDHIANPWQGHLLVYRSPNGETVRVEPRLRCNSLVDVLRFVRGGFGVALLPDLAVRQDLADGTLVTLVPDFEAQIAPIYALHLFERQVPQKVSAFLNLLRECFRGT